MRSSFVLSALVLAACGGKVVVDQGPTGTGGTAPATGCAISITSDGGMGSDVVCEIDWSCSSGAQQFQVVCTPLSGGDMSCTCSSNQTTMTGELITDAVACEATSASPLADLCGFPM